MNAKRQMGKVSLAYGLSQSEDAKSAWESYDVHKARCIELKKQIDEFKKNNNGQ